MLIFIMMKARHLPYAQLRSCIRSFDNRQLKSSTIAFTLNKKRLWCKIEDIISYPSRGFGIYFSNGNDGYWIWGRSRLSRWISNKSEQTLRIGVEAISIGGKMMLVEVDRAMDAHSSAFRALIQKPSH
ncbi:MAG: hypothetical protein K6T83_23445 [Alicyclobacillus sp.]|nr:hypothetical protein [Alicyclobacillus sp.]